MGTRGHCKVVDRDGNTLVRLYRQFDSYPTGMGVDIRDMLNEGDVDLVNGYGKGMDNPEVFNGMGDLAAYFIGTLKLDEGHDGRTIGNIYVAEPDASEDGTGIEYIYKLYPEGMPEEFGDDPGNLHVEVRGHVPTDDDFDPTGDPRPVIYDGPLADFDPRRAEDEYMYPDDPRYECMDCMAIVPEGRVRDLDEPGEPAKCPECDTGHVEPVDPESKPEPSDGDGAGDAEDPVAKYRMTTPRIRCNTCGHEGAEDSFPVVEADDGTDVTMCPMCYVHDYRAEDFSEVSP